jgi:hypothetical protein
MSGCLHCDIHEMLESHLQSEQADVAEIAGKVTEVPHEPPMMMANVLATLGGIVLQKSQDADPDNPPGSRH